jgi:uncharacterized RDD family membrane protein YckC
MTHFSTPSFLRRIISMIYEGLLLGGVLAVFFLLPQTLYSMLSGRAAAPALTFLHFFILLLFYFNWFWLRGGQTLAMKTWRIQLIDVSGAPLRPMQAALRYMAAWVSIGFGGIGLLWCFFDRNKQFLHDRIADTRLVEIPAPPKPSKTAVPTTF